MDTLQTPLYAAEGDAFVRQNGDRFGNRPLYCNHNYAVVFAGDKPFLRLGNNHSISGNFMLALVRAGRGKWLPDFSECTAKYRPGRMEWIVRDKCFGATEINLQVVPAETGAGMVLRATIENAEPGDQLIWVSGGATQESQSVLWHYDPTTENAELLQRSFEPDDCRGDRVQLDGARWTIQPPSGKRDNLAATGSCSEPAKIFLSDASEWKNPAELITSLVKDLPCVVGTISLTNHSEIFWSFGDTDHSGHEAAAFAAGEQCVEATANQVVVATPDPWLNLAVAASCSVIDGVFRDGIYTHSGMRWSTPLLGWRTQFGGTVYGWHSNVLTEAKICLAKQITNSNKLLPQADEADGLACQSLDSRLFGKGRVSIYQPWHYDMQSQFFDQLVHAWRWTGDAALAKILQPGLELHLEYIRDCFDPDGDGLYESYANTWPTDDQWYNGGGTAEETAYAYNSEKAALKFAQLADDKNLIQAHQAQLEKIRHAFLAQLWIPNSGHVGAYREQIGGRRLHESSWLYSAFCPIDAGLLDQEQAAQALYYTEWGLERIKMPYGGEQCWPSGWVPSIWSVREMWPGDNYQLALAYFQTGLADDGWSLLRGTFPQEMFFGRVPGNLGHPAGATDFNDCASMFCRAVVEGLFGYAPNYPDGIVKIAPQFPGDWQHASIRTPDFKFNFLRQEKVIRYQIELAQKCALEISVPVSAKKIASVKVNDAAADWKLLPGFGQSVVQIHVPVSASAKVEIVLEAPLPIGLAVKLEGNSGNAISLAPQNGTVIECHDPQHVFDTVKIVDGKISGTLSTNAGDHLVLALTQVGETTQWREFKIKVTDVSADAARAAKLVQTIPANAQWDCLDLQKIFNGDVRTIFQQKYLSPRPNTCSLRLADDGYSTWQMKLDKKNRPPTIDFSDVPQLLKPSNRLVTSQGIPFLWANDKTNILFTSQWDNWPHTAAVPVGKSGDAIWFLVCGSSNPMQVQIANAELRMKYADGVIEKLVLVPPLNFWSLCPLGGADYNYERDAFCLPKIPPATVQLGKNCRAILLNWRLRPGIKLASVTLETVSSEVVIGLMGLTIMNPH